MPEDTTGTPTGQTPGEPQTGAQSSGNSGDPPPRTYTESDVAAARRAAEKKAKEAAEQTTSLQAQLEEAQTALAAAQEQQQSVEDEKKSELERTLDRMQKAEQRAEAEAARAETAEAEKRAADRLALVASVSAERGLALPMPFLGLVEGADAESIGTSLDALVEVGRKVFVPKSIGAANNPPHAAPIETPTDNAALTARVKTLTDAMSDPRHPEHKGAEVELARIYGMSTG